MTALPQWIICPRNRSAALQSSRPARPAREVSLEAIEAYTPVITLLLKPLNTDEGKIMDEALRRYAEEDTTLLVRLDDESGARLVSGMGELHLDILLERMRREFGIGPRTERPQVVQRETVTGEAESSVLFDKKLGKERHHGAVSLRVRPRQRLAGNLVTVDDSLQNTAEAQKNLPGNLLQAALDGVHDALQSGGASGLPVVDASVSVTGVAHHEGLTTAPGCHTAAGQALREAVNKACPSALEPIMRVEINLPAEFLGPAISTLSTCSGKVDSLDDHTGQKLLRGSAPLRKLFGFSTALRSATQGRAGLSQTFDRFDAP
ncbi:hypothetical protein [Candidatus Desulfovibrio trichonymphae]|uniref:hypothetical protein n=1 Tax=Candidatus Desulfovibrio trichonymphae TaxID=1725232 RepID=UPI00221AFC80|nr:hypothetical protein AGMMS50248_09240 [Deltaproteobacteria bacterium]